MKQEQSYFTIFIASPERSFYEFKATFVSSVFHPQLKP